MPYRILMFLVTVTLLTFSTIQAQNNSRIAVTWIENGDVYVWRTGDSTPTRYPSGQALQSYISPDGQYIAFTTLQPSSLWLVKGDNAASIQIVPNTALASTDTQFINISNVQWGRNNILYFNTLFQSEYALAQIQDLWSVDVTTETFKQLLPLSKGGVFTLSPNSQFIALVQPGNYNDTNGSIRILSLPELNEQNYFSFDAVSTASNYDFYPSIDWNQSGQSLKVAIPNKDLVYHDDTELTTLWELEVNGAKTKLGTLQVSFFGLPHWSTDGQYLTYLRHQGGITTNQFDLIVANGNGDNQQVYTSGSAGKLGNAEWIPNSHQFMYPQFDLGHSWIGEPEKPPSAIPEKIFKLRFLNSRFYVYAGEPGYGFELYIADRDTGNTTYIAKVQAPFPIFDAVIY